MTFSNYLANPAEPLVLDTSVLINLHASRRGELILDAIPNEIVVPLPVITELNHQTSRTNGEADFIDALVSSEKVQKAALSDSEFKLFEQIVTMNKSLGDGEAATIAVATYNQSIAIMDDRKARNFVLESMTEPKLGWSIETFLHPSVISRIGEPDIAEAIYLALRDGRMRIHESQCETVVKMIGVQRALDCPSLPGYKVRCDGWRRRINDESYSQATG